MSYATFCLKILAQNKRTNLKTNKFKYQKFDSNVSLCLKNARASILEISATNIPKRKSVPISSYKTPSLPGIPVTSSIVFSTHKNIYSLMRNTCILISKKSQMTFPSRIINSISLTTYIDVKGTCLQKIHYQLSKMFIKNALFALSDKIFGPKHNSFTKQLLMPLILLTTIKDYVQKATCNEPIFVVPKSVQDRVNHDRAILVLDLDQTLIYSRQSTLPHHSNFISVQSVDGERYIVQLRPFVNEFLTATASIFTIYVYTAGRKAYADAVIDAIDVNRVIQKRFYRDSCVSYKGSFVKNLKKIIKEDNKKVILVDDNKESIRINSPQSLLILPFQGNQKDRELINIFNELLKLYQ